MSGVTAIVDYGVGNLFSLEKSLKAIGESAIVTSSAMDLRHSDRIILPGVGAFGDAMHKLRDTGLSDALYYEARRGKKILGICLGMQLLFNYSYEFGRNKGLGILPGEVVPISKVIPSGYKIPHIGWNSLHMTREDSKLMSRVKEGEYVYFVHSYYAIGCDDATVAVTEYGGELTAAVERSNVFGCQFHPEKSGETGLNILRAFCEED